MRVYGEGLCASVLGGECMSVPFLGPAPLGALKSAHFVASYIGWAGLESLFFRGGPMVRFSPTPTGVARGRIVATRVTFERHAQAP